MFAMLCLLAQESEATQPQGNLLTMIWPFLLILPLFYLLILRPARKQERDRQSLIGNTKKNDKVVTTSGIIGTVVSISDDELVIKADENVRLRMIKGSILRNLTQEETLKAGSPQSTSGAKGSDAVKEKTAK
jgi:preprotein translocase subunit YajC